MGIFELILLPHWSSSSCMVKKQMWRKNRMFQALGFEGPNRSGDLVLWSSEHWRLKGLWLSGAVFLSLSKGPVFSGVTIGQEKKERELRLSRPCEGRIWAFSGIKAEISGHSWVCQESLGSSLKLPLKIPKWDNLQVSKQREGISLYWRLLDS